MNILSLGAGVQSSALLMLYERGELSPKPDFAIFSDTGAEPKFVYDWLEKIKSLTSIPIHVVKKGNLFEDIKSTDGRRVASIPLFVKNLSGKQGMLRRQCTQEYKITPIQKECRRLLGYLPRQRIKEKITMIIGISTDEVTRMKPSRTHWIVNKYPLIFNKKWSRQDCIKYVESLGIGTPPKSACVFCPFHDDAQWRELKSKGGAGWQMALDADRAIRNPIRIKGECFVHRSMLPLDQVDLDKHDDNLNLFENECEGMCGV